MSLHMLCDVQHNSCLLPCCAQGDMCWGGIPTPHLCSRLHLAVQNFPQMMLDLTLLFESHTTGICCSRAESNLHCADQQLRTWRIPNSQHLTSAGCWCAGHVHVAAAGMPHMAHHDAFLDRSGHLLQLQLLTIMYVSHASHALQPCRTHRHIMGQHRYAASSTHMHQQVPTCMDFSYYAD